MQPLCPIPFAEPATASRCILLHCYHVRCNNRARADTLSGEVETEKHSALRSSHSLAQLVSIHTIATAIATAIAAHNDRFQAGHCCRSHVGGVKAKDPHDRSHRSRRGTGASAIASTRGSIRREPYEVDWILPFAGRNRPRWSRNQESSFATVPVPLSRRAS